MLTRVHCSIITLVVLIGFTSFFSPSARAENWPSWRGPTGTGAANEKDLPLKWNWSTKKNEVTSENVLWTAPLKGFTGHSCPIVWGDKLFLTTADKQTREQESNREVPLHHINCYSVADGKLLWTTQIEPGKEPMGYAIYAVPTPCTDGKTVFAWFGSAVIAAVNADDGKLIWRHERAGPFSLNPGITSSPILYEDNVLLLCDQSRGKGWLQALDKKTGEIKWEQKRAKVDTNNSTPLLLDVKGRQELVISASKELQGLDPKTGELIWWCKARGFGASPAYGSGLIFSDTGNGEMGVVVDPTGSGDVTATHLKWSIPKIPSQYGSAIVVGDYVYRASDKQTITCWKLATGEQIFSEKAEGVSKLSSPFATPDGRIYFASSGKSYVLKAGPTFEVLSTNDLKNGDNAASAAVSGGKIFIRGNEMLFCIGNKPQ